MWVKRPLVQAIGCSLALFCAANATAWHELGHMIVGQVADDIIQDKHPQLVPTMSNLLEAAKKYFASQGFDEGQFASTAQAATFLDTYSEKNMSSKGWHYINGPYIPQGQINAVSQPDLEKHTNLWPNAPVELTVSLGVLKQASADIKSGQISDDVALAYVTVLHLVGDIHQPLHTISLYSDDFPKGDEGGNAFKITGVTYEYNLHSYWDSMGKSFPEIVWHDTDCMKSVREDTDTVTSYFSNHPLPSNISSVTQSLDPWDWAYRLYMAAKTTAYSGVTPGGTVSEDYEGKVQNYSKLLVYMAGEQLADVLAYALDDEKPTNRKRIKNTALSREQANKAHQKGFINRHLNRQQRQKNIELSRQQYEANNILK